MQFLIILADWFLLRCGDPSVTAKNTYAQSTFVVRLKGKAVEFNL